MLPMISSEPYLYRLTGRNREAADEWFGQRRLQKVLAAVRQVANDTEAGPIDPPVKVAIVDTGVDGSHEQIRRAIETKTICSGRGFPNSVELPPFQDAQGHGTHAASVFLQTAPDALLCIARISHKSPDYEDIVKVSLLLSNNDI